MSQEESVNISHQDLLFADYSREGMTSHLNDPSGRYQWAVFGYQKPGAHSPGSGIAVRRLKPIWVVCSIGNWQGTGASIPGIWLPGRGDDERGESWLEYCRRREWWDRRLTTSFEYAQSAFYRKSSR